MDGTGRGVGAEAIAPPPEYPDIIAELLAAYEELVAEGAIDPS